MNHELLRDISRTIYCRDFYDPSEPVDSPRDIAIRCKALIASEKQRLLAKHWTVAGPGRLTALLSLQKRLKELRDV